VSNKPLGLPTLYARYEPTSDRMALAYARGGKPKRDVCLYADDAAADYRGRFTWSNRRKPNRASRTCLHGNLQWQLVWLEDLAQ
jgi:hypothetical protein